MQIPTGLKEKLDIIPQLPGIYKMLDARGSVIYVGKSKSLRHRVKSYFTGTRQWSKIEKLVSLVRDIEYEVTDTHLEARLLECSLIKTLKPEFNAQMKNDRKYVYLKVEAYNRHKTLSVVSERSEDTYGPFRGKYQLLDLIDKLNNLFPILKTSGNYEFDYHAIPLPMDKETFDKNRSSLIGILNDQDCMGSFIKAVECKMNEAAATCRFETAGKYRDIIQGLKNVSYRLNLYADFLARDFLLKLPIPGGVKLFYVSKGDILHKERCYALAESDIYAFLDKARAKGKALADLNSLNSRMDEKAGIDFKDIIFSEISSLPEDHVLAL